MRIAVALAVSILCLSGVARAEDGNVDEKSRVCMVQDMIMEKPGIPVEQGGKTYFGCCPMCSGKIAEEAARYTKAKDPVSQAMVDKADAFVFALGGKAYYFESEATRAQFGQNPAKYAGSAVTDGPATRSP